jgi:cytochrome d ubiquinol oxidase subunit II
MAGYRPGRAVAGRGIDGYAFVGEVVTDGPSNPLMSEVERGGSWLQAYADAALDHHRPVLGFVGWRMAFRGLRSGLRGLDAAVVQARRSSA